MNKLFLAVAGTVLLGTGCSAIGQRDMSSGQGMMDMKSGQGMMAHMMMKMDTNGDGMLSKEEFMKGHEAMFDQMKGANGMISLKDMKMKDMHMNGMGMMGHGDMQGSDHAMSGCMGKGMK